MLGHDLLYGAPFLQSLRADHIDTPLAEVVDLSFIRTASCAVVFEVNVNDEVFWNNSVFVFSDVLGAELHLTSFDVVSSLDEGRVEHDAAHRLTREAHVLEEDLNVALHDDTLSLLLRQQKDHTVLALTVEFLCRVSELFSNIETSAAVNFEERYATATGHIWHLNELDSSDALGSRRLNLVPKERFKVVQVA